MTDKEAIDVTNQVLDQCVGLGFFKTRQQLYLVEQAFQHLQQGIQERAQLLHQVATLQEKAGSSNQDT